MSQIKQLLLLKKDGVSNRSAAKIIGMNKETVNHYVNKVKDDKLSIDELLKLDDPILEHRLKCGNPAYTDNRFETFKELLLDRDVATIYGVETKRVNEAVRNNPDKFPKGYVIELDISEIRYLRSKSSTTNLSSKVRTAPKAFTEKGLYMLATVLKSPRATDTTLAIIESYARLRELSRNLNILSNETDAKKQNRLAKESGKLLQELFTVEEKGDITETESSIELNLYALKMKRTVKKTKKG